ncbi:MAG: hypothetical protein E7292_10195 [Lachnospiraceae bacterium]|nr:hypothetical protein [Lachnospiraceae bacterium]
MKKRTIILATMMALTFTSCGDATQTEAPTSTVTVPESTTEITDKASESSIETNTTSDENSYTATLSIQYSTHQDAGETTSKSENGTPQKVILPEQDSSTTYIVTQNFDSDTEEMVGTCKMESSGAVSVNIELPVHFYVVKNNDNYTRYDAMEMFGETSCTKTEVDETASVNLIDLCNQCKDEQIAASQIINLLSNTSLGLYEKVKTDITAYEGIFLPATVTQTETGSTVSVDLTGLDLQQFYSGIITSGSLDISIDNSKSIDVEVPDDIENSVLETESEESEIEVKSDVDYIGKTVAEFLADGNELNGYSGNGESYEFSAVNSKARMSYRLVLSDDATEIMKNKDFFDEYEDLVADCTIVEIESHYADDSILQPYVGKTLADLEADGISVSGYMSSSFSLTLTSSSHLTPIYIEFSEEDMAIYNALQDPDTEDIVEAYKDCPIAAIYYVIY